MSSFTLKLIAIITMLIDHIGAVLIPQGTLLNLIMRSIGRISFPIFVFLIVEGFFHTRNVQKYLLRLGIFALISEIPFDLAFYGRIFRHSHQNIFFTLFLGLLLITLMNMVEKKYPRQILTSTLLDSILILTFAIIAIFLKTDYTYLGILLIVSFYMFRGRKIMLTLSLLVVTGFLMGGISIIATLAMIPIAFYNGQKGKDVKYLFYTFYPAHLLILAIINLIFIV